jgi:hypothetical protein
MAKTIDVKSCQIIIRLGDTPQWQIAADEDETANPQDMKYRSKGFDSEQVSLLREFVNTMLKAYPQDDLATICSNGNAIVEQKNCAARKAAAVKARRPSEG